MKSTIFAASIAGVVAQKAGTLTEEKHPKLDWSECTASGCTTVHSEVTIDSNWRWTHVAGETTNCYTGNLWDESLCPDVATCSSNCVVEGADQEYEALMASRLQATSLNWTL